LPLNGGEQMYQALRSLGVPTELVIYPGQFHGLTQVSFIRDRYQRYLDWYDKYLMPKPGDEVAGVLIVSRAVTDFGGRHVRISAST
jgi:acetyl esterase/lipase